MGFVFVLSGCGWEPNPTEPFYSRSIVHTIREYTSIELFPDTGEDFDISVECYYNRSVDCRASGSDKVWFDSICDKYGDNHYNRDITNKQTTIHTLLIPDIIKINISSSDDFDKEHPAGSSLNDCFSLTYETLDNIIKSDYITVYSSKITIDGPFLNQEKMVMIAPQYSMYWNTERSLGANEPQPPVGGALFKLTAKKIPTNQVQHLSLEVVTEGGQVLAGALEYDFHNSLLGKRTSSSLQIR